MTMSMMFSSRMLHSPVDDVNDDDHDDDDDDNDDDDVNDVLLHNVALARHSAGTLRRARDTLLTGKVAKCNKCCRYSSAKKSGKKLKIKVLLTKVKDDLSVFSVYRF